MSFLTSLNGQLYILAYVLGSIPFGLILARLYAGVDIREEGSKSIGATNVLRVVRAKKDEKLAKKLAGFTLGLDALKGAILLLIAKFALGVPEATLWGIAVLAVAGHCFSIFLWGEGGKGVATSIGVVAVMLPVEGLIALMAWALSGKVFKISSLSSLIGLMVSVVSSFIIHPDIYHAPLIIIAIIIIYKHLPNIYRLIRKEESKAL